MVDKKDDPLTFEGSDGMLHLTPLAQKALNQVLRKSIKVMDFEYFELWWESNMPNANQQEAWKAYQRTKGQ